MADQLYLSCRLQGFNPLSVPAQFEKLLEMFPYSKLARSQPSLRIYGVAYSEPALFEAPVEQPIDIRAVIAAARDFQNADVCYELTASWDLWQWDEEWKLAPAPVQLTCYGPEFDSPTGEHLQISLGPEEQFLPGSAPEAGLPMIRSNIRSLLKLVADLKARLPLEQVRLWSESGENFAERLEGALGGAAAWATPTRSCRGPAGV